MESYLMNCVVCLSSNNLHKFGVFGKRKYKANECDEADESRCVDNQVQVIFLLRKMLGIPYGVCTKFFQEYGNPSSWIYCCSSCSVLVDKARSVFDDMALLQKKFEKLQKEMKEAIVVSVNSHEKVFLSDLQKGPKEIVRSFITKEYYDGQSNPQIKVEPQDFEDGDDKFNLDFLDWSPLQSSDEEIEKDEDCVSLSNFNANGTESSNGESSNYFSKSSEENSGKEYSCDICGKCFSAKVTLSTHKLIHTGNSLHECDVCKKRFTQAGSLKIHYRIHTGERPFVCQYCGKGFPEPYRLKCHIMTHTAENKPITCEICHRRFSNYETLKIHLKIHDDNRKPNSLSMYKCQVCDEEFSQPALLAEHSKTVHDLAIAFYKCEICHKSFLDLAEYTLHKKSPCPGELHYTCNVCQAKFATEKLFHTHLKTHEYACNSNDDDFKCKECGEQFKSPTLLTFHFKKEHSDKTLTYPCHVCGKKFLVRPKLRRHIIEVHGDFRPFPCSECDHRFKNSSSLKSHMKTHARKCELCGEVFTQINDLNSHIANQHTPQTTPCPQPPHQLNSEITDEQTLGITPCPLQQNELSHLPTDQQKPDTALSPPKVQKDKPKEFLCYNCGNKYSDENELKEHVKTHAGEYRHQCDWCGKNFLKKEGLKIHYRNHTGETPYKCEFCGKTFKQRVSLILHRRIHTGEKPYPCTICSKSFTQSSHLYRHQNTHLRKVFK